MDVPHFIVAHSVVGICIDIDGKLWFINEVFAQIFGYSRHEFLGMEVAELVYFEIVGGYLEDKQDFRQTFQ
ncbi:MAG: PAS domain-containing protein [Thermodesulfobacteriota bacterium]|nr:PAS domain-containing protein [Thermodesulfobacteriota bacterium]